MDDVDLFIGGVAERPLPGALLGPTFTCIIGDQFARSKKSDRFAYDLGGKDSSFLPGNLCQTRILNSRVEMNNSVHSYRRSTRANSTCELRSNLV